MPPAEMIDKQLKHLNFKNSALRKSCKADPPEISKHGGFQGGKGNAKGAGRPLSYPTSVDEEMKVRSVNSKKNIICHFVREHLCFRGFRHNLKVRYHFIPNVRSFSK